MIYDKPDGRNEIRRIIDTGIWVDADDNMHFHIPDLLKLVDLEDTPENREQVTTMIREVIAEHAPAAEIIDRDSPDD